MFFVFVEPRGPALENTKKKLRKGEKNGFLGFPVIIRTKEKKWGRFLIDERRAVERAERARG